MRLTVDGIDLRIAEGSKFPGDLVIEMRHDGRWKRPKFELAYVLADFFAENEAARARHEQGWSWNGDTYFMTRLRTAVKDGWEAPAEETRRQRLARRGAA